MWLTYYAVFGSTQPPTLGETGQSAEADDVGGWFVLSVTAVGNEELRADKELSWTVSVTSHDDVTQRMTSHNGRSFSRRNSVNTHYLLTLRHISKL